MKDFNIKLDRYAALAVKIGVNIQKGQTLLIKTTLDSVELVRLIVKKAYEAGARDVVVDWRDDVVDKTRFEMANEEVFNSFSHWYAREREELVEKGAAFMYIDSSSPDLLEGVQVERVSNFNKAKGKEMYAFSRYIQTDRISWTMIANPSADWAAKVFPDAPKENQVEMLWDAIFRATRSNTENPVEAWKEHVKNLQSKANYLTNKQYKMLVYKASGTELYVELPKEHIWVGSSNINKEGIEFISNMPVEEVYTAPLKMGVNGYVASTKPLSYGGNIIDGFTLTFENGRIVSVKAKKGEEILKNLIAIDEGSSYLGEVALVPFNSPISQSNVLFFNTLFDENASNHIAIGSSYPICIEGGKAMTSEELVKNGLNESIVHVDFMIGSADMDIYGITADGTKEAIFRKGNWAMNSK
jgi:aminopeptidase